MAEKGSSSSTTASKPLPPPTHTSCTSVVYIGDSTSDGEANPEYVPNGKLRAPAQLRKVGVKHVHMEVSGARSIVETFEGIPNGATVAQGYVAHGYHGCWILALGTNDSADVNAGSNVGLKARIHRDDAHHRQPAGDVGQRADDRRVARVLRGVRDAPVGRGPGRRLPAATRRCA